MQSGSLAEEWRERPGPPGEPPVRLGPYFKHQAWHDGRNVSRRVPAAGAENILILRCLVLGPYFDTAWKGWDRALMARFEDFRARLVFFLFPRAFFFRKGVPCLMNFCNYSGSPPNNHFSLKK
jgi:hypothetical protein